jgi:hypothetical protein
MDTRVSDATTSVTVGEQIVARRPLLPLARLRALMAALEEGTAPPACAEAQADGVPCPSAAHDCARCDRARSVFESLQRGPEAR